MGYTSWLGIEAVDNFVSSFIPLCCLTSSSLRLIMVSFEQYDTSLAPMHHRKYCNTVSLFGRNNAGDEFRCSLRCLSLLASALSPATRGLSCCSVTVVFMREVRPSTHCSGRRGPLHFSRYPNPFLLFEPFVPTCLLTDSPTLTPFFA